MAYRENHIASTFYLARWAGPDGRLMAVEPPDPEATPRLPARVGWRRDFWGRDPSVRRNTEITLNRIETRAAPALRGVVEKWPLRRGSDEWRAIAFFLAIHFWRNPYGQRHLDRLQRTVLEQRLRLYMSKWGPPEVEALLKHVTTDAYRAEVLIRNLPAGASLLGSMHWTLLKFEEDVLATSDQPLTVVPILAPGETAPVLPLPTGSLLDCEEVRFPVSPRHALLLTWLDEPDDGPAIRADESIAAQLNRTAILQADSQWFHHPARRPTALLPPLLEVSKCAPVGRYVTPGYGSEAARESRRRHETSTNVARLIDSDRVDQMVVVNVQRPAA